MDQNRRNFGIGPRELTGSTDLINRFKLIPHHHFFCKRALPSSIRETHYLRNIVGETDIMKGEGMELDQLFKNKSYLPEKSAKIKTFDLDTLGQAFQLRETAPVHLPNSERGTPTISCKTKSEEEREKKHKRKREKEGREKDREQKKHKHHHHHKENGKDKSKEKEKEKEKEIKKQANGHFVPPSTNDPSRRQTNQLSHGVNVGNSQQRRNFGVNNQDLSSMQKHKRGLMG